jgi:FkbM family methyltransferase
MNSICLCMIVKDEAAVITRCLDSTRGLIDSWVICDTGSIDDTRQLIGRALSQIPGELHERPWVDFGHNRTELMALAEGRADYLLLIDADMTVTYDAGALRNLTADSYVLRHDEDPEYWIKRLVRGDRTWRYVGATHEYITSDGPDRNERLDAIVIHHHGDGGTRPKKYERDLRLLTRAYERDPDDPRTVFYLANTLQALGRFPDAIEYHARRAGMAGWEEEIFYSMYQVGVLSLGLDRRADAIEALFAAWSRGPHRAEPLCVLASVFRERGEHRAAHLVADRGLRIRMPVEGLFVQRWIYEWGLLFEFSIAAYWVGQPRAALNACDRLLALPGLPEAHRRQTIANREFCMRARPALPSATSSARYRWQRPPPTTPSTNASRGHQNTTLVEAGHPLEHRGTEADLGVIRQVFTERAYALEPLRGWPGLERYRSTVGLGGAPLIVDCGAHIGAASVWFALRHPDARITALEPDPDNFALLRRNAATFAQITPLPYAIAATAGTVRLVDPGRGSWGMRASRDPLVTAGEPGGEAEALSIDRVLEMNAHAIPFILKVDIEGAEGDLFAAHWRELARFAVVIVELHDWLLPGLGTSRGFLRWHVAHNRDLVPIGENLVSVAAELGSA